MYRERGGVGSKSEVGSVGSVGRKRTNDVLDKQLERSPPSTSREIKAKDSSAKSILAAKLPYDHMDSYSASDGHIKESQERYLKQTMTNQKVMVMMGMIYKFCTLRGNEFFCEVDDNYIQDDFNLYGLSSQVSHYDCALDLILDVESSHGDMFTEELNELTESDAKMLYGLIHARYVLTNKGMDAMLHKYKKYHFGRCPRAYCSRQSCLPVGQSDIPRSSTVKIYCPSCEDIYYPRYKCQGNVDGAYFGTTFPHLFLMTYGYLKTPEPWRRYVPRVFGFKVHKPSP